MGNVQDKVNWCAFLADARFDIIVDNLLEGAQIVIGGGFKNAQRSVLINRGNCEDLVPLKSDHEEADHCCMQNMPFVNAKGL